MRTVRLGSQTDFVGWRNAARALIAQHAPPEEVEWLVGDDPSLFGTTTECADIEAARFTVPRAFIGLAERAILHGDRLRFGLLYRLLWRLTREPRLLEIASDPDVARLRGMKDAVDRDIHKTHAFVRFRQIEDERGPLYIAWFEPSHHTLEAAAPFFVRRFAIMRWSILTPRASAHWDGDQLRFGPGAHAADASADDALEELWRTYYASIFNPARLKTATMQAHMPRKYWRNLPEAALIGKLVARARHDTGGMLERAPNEARPRFAGSGGSVPAPETALAQFEGRVTLSRLQSAAQQCTRCPLHASATQAVFGEGPSDARVMMVGEQPGDQEDLAGRPFVGPAGQLFDRALARAGIDRDRIYVTNAVKHFKFEPRGKRRLHKTPAQVEIEACRFWLEQEIRRIGPALIVALGATAAYSVLGKPTPVRRNRGRIISVSDDTQVLITVHPSYLLRIPPEAQDAELARFVADLRLSLQFMRRAVAT
jgi:DNA polymerase